jgi:chromosome segregation ATPase
MRLASGLAAAWQLQAAGDVAMSEKTMDERVGDLEKVAQTLAPLPGQMAQLSDRVAGVESRLGDVESRLGTVESRLGTVESQIVLLRSDMNDGFSAIRGELKDGLVGVRTELREAIAALGRDTAAHFVQAGIEMRTLFEAHLGRRNVIAEGNPTPDAPPSGP